MQVEEELEKNSGRLQNALIIPFQEIEERIQELDLHKDKKILVDFLVRRLSA